MNGDKASTITVLFTMTQQHGMLWVGTGMMPSNRKDSKRDDINYVASFAGLSATTPADASVDEVAGRLVSQSAGAHAPAHRYQGIVYRVPDLVHPTRNEFAKEA